MITQECFVMFILELCCVLTQSCPTLCSPMDCSPPGTSVHGDSPGKNTWSGLPCSPPGDLPNPGMESRSPTLQADSLPAETPGRPKYTGVGSLSLLQGTLLPNPRIAPDLLHCRILYQPSYQGSP